MVVGWRGGVAEYSAGSAGGVYEGRVGAGAGKGHGRGVDFEFVGDDLSWVQDRGDEDGGGAEWRGGGGCDVRNFWGGGMKGLNEGFRARRGWGLATELLLARTQLVDIEWVEASHAIFSS